MSTPTKTWSSRFTFLCAVVGASIGLGNLWRFPYIAGENGGGAFIIVYLVIILLLCVPLIMAELAMGRRGGKSPVVTMINLCREGGYSGFWTAIGWLSVLAPVAGLCFYAVVAGWALDYVFLALRGEFVSITPDDAERKFTDLLASPGRLTLWYTLYIAATVWVIGLGVKRGIETVTTFMLPTLFVMIVVLVIYGHIEGAPARAWQFMFNPDFSRLTWQSLLIALGQALFSITVGTGALLTYGAYLSRDISLPGPTWIIAVSDTLAALMCGLAVFTIVFASGLDPTGGPGLMFVTLPIAFGSMPAGYFFSVVFFVLVFFCGIYLIPGHAGAFRIVPGRQGLQTLYHVSAYRFCHLAGRSQRGILVQRHKRVQAPVVCPALPGQEHVSHYRIQRLEHHAAVDRIPDRPVRRLGHFIRFIAR